MESTQICETVEINLESQEDLIKQRTLIDLINESHIGQTMTICGWIQTMRWQKKLIFGKLYDSGLSILSPLQVIFETNKAPTAGYYDSLQTVSRGASIVIKGTIVKSPKSEQPIEIVGHQYYIIGGIYDPQYYPLAGTATDNVELLRSLPYLECHSRVKSAIYKTRSILECAIATFFTSKNFTKCDLPVITFSECEGGCQPMQATLLLTDNKKTSIPIKQTITGESTDQIDFSKDFFGAKASLTVSAQLELETRLSLGNVWTMTRAFRGEPSQTTRHLCEFSMIEFELAFTSSAIDIMNISEELIKYCIEFVLTHGKKYLEYLQSFYTNDIIAKLTQYVSTPFVKIRHAEAVSLMLDHAANKVIEFRELPTYDGDLSSEHERYLTDTVYKLPVIVMRYPKTIKAFYMPVIEETQEESHGVEHVDCFDLLVPGVGELVGGSQRIWNYDELMSRITELGLDVKALEDYTKLRLYGSVPHGGAGIGFERLIALITGAASVKDCVAYPRYMGSGKQH